ncbi:hypothetical protein MARINOS108_140004 [Marinoscillum sp. 108]|nr:hypothetical protein MARINOS108_140004 [Marinoscillum sp. 108]
MALTTSLLRNQKYLWVELKSGCNHEEFDLKKHRNESFQNFHSPLFALFILL